MTFFEHVSIHIRIQVIVIENGCLVEQGTHDDLIAANGIYKQLVIRQLTAGELQGDNSD